MSARRNTCTAVLFLFGLLAAVVFLCFGMIPKHSGFPDAGEAEAKETQTVSPDDGAPVPLKSGEETSLPQFIEGSEPAINELLDRNHTFIELYGGVQRLLGRRVVEDVDPQYTVVKLTDSVLTFASLEPEQVDMTTRAQEMLSFAQRVEREYSVPLLYIQAPSKLNAAQLPSGIEDYSNAEADQFLSLLQSGGVDTLDLRPLFQKASETDPDCVGTFFFHTDHHWTPAGAFLGYQAICEKLKEDYQFEIDREWTDPDSFQRISFEDIFLGSQGRRVGSLYAGLDDFELWSPQFSTAFTYTVPLTGIEREGPFATSLLFPERLNEIDYYNNNLYTIYAGDDYLLSRAVNLNNPSGKRILILRDSFGCALTPFLSLASSELMAIDPRNFNGDQDAMMKFIDWLEPDIILVMNTTSSLRVDTLYPYLPTARKTVSAAQAGQN